MHPLLFSLRVCFHSHSTSVGEHGGLSGQMSAFHAGDVAEREHHRVETALHHWGMGTTVILQLHHCRRHRVAHPVRCSSLEVALLHLQRPRRVRDCLFLYCYACEFVVSHDPCRCGEWDAWMQLYHTAHRWVGVSVQYLILEIICLVLW